MSIANNMDVFMCRACGILQPCDCENSWLEPEPEPICPACGHHTAVVLGTRGNTDICRCRACGAEFTMDNNEEEL